MSNSSSNSLRDIPKELLDSAHELEQFPLGNCGPSDDPDKQTAYLYSFREIANRFVAAARRLNDPEVDVELARLNTKPEFITDAYDLRSDLLPIIDLLRHRATVHIDGLQQKQTPSQAETASFPISAFISYSSLDKSIAADVKRLLTKFGVQTFLAHDDISVSQEWKVRIIEELRRCNIFVPLISKNFRASDWAPQEIGAIAIRQDVVVVPLVIDDSIPYGFISHIQGHRVPTIGPNFELVIQPLVERFARTIIPEMICEVDKASSFRAAEAALQLLVRYFPLLTEKELSSLLEASIRNGQVWNAKLCCEEYLPKLIATEGHRMAAERRSVLKYQIENRQWYPEQ